MRLLPPKDLLRQVRRRRQSDSEIWLAAFPEGIRRVCRLHGKLARVLKSVDGIDVLVASNRLDPGETQCESTGVASAGLD